MFKEKNNSIFFLIRRKFLETSQEFDKTERIEKIKLISKAKKSLTVLENEIIQELIEIHQRKEKKQC